MRENVDCIRDNQNFFYLLSVHQEQIEEANYLFVPCDEKELNSGLQVAFFDLDTRKVPASI